jgi:hypothetical protein
MLNWLRARLTGCKEWAGALLPALLVALHIVNTLMWSVALPLWQGTDEAAHFGLVQYIAETGRLPGPEQRFRSDEIVISSELSDASRLPWDPTQRQSFVPGTEGLREQEIDALPPHLRISFERRAANQVMLVPPLYGAVGSVFYRLSYNRNIIERSFAVRLYATLISAASLVFVFLLARELWPECKHLWTTLALLVSFQPQFTYSAAGGTSDVLAMLWFTVLTYLIVRTVRRGMRYSLAAWMGIALGLGLLTKPHLFLTGPAFAVLFIYMWWSERNSRRKIAVCAAIVAGIGLAIWIPWAVRSYRLNDNPFYDDPWGGEWVTVEDPQYDYPLGRYVVDYVASLVGGLFASYWGIFGYLDTPISPAYYYLLLALALCSAVGLGWRTWRARGSRPQTRTLVAFAIMAALALTPVLYFGFFNYRMWREMGIGWPLMGRHLAGPLAAQMALWVWGLFAWVPKRARMAGHLFVRAGIVVLNYACLFGFVLPRYYL